MGNSALKKLETFTASSPAQFQQVQHQPQLQACKNTPGPKHSLLTSKAAGQGNKEWLVDVSLLIKINLPFRNQQDGKEQMKRVQLVQLVHKLR